MSEPSALCLSVTLPPTGFDTWRDAPLSAPNRWSDWDMVGARASDFALWQRVGAVRVASVINGLITKGQREGSVLFQSQGPRIELVALLASDTWQEQLLILGAIRMLEEFGATDGWALMHDYVFGRAGTAWAVEFPARGRAALSLDAPIGVKRASDALVLPFLDAQRLQAD